LLWFNGSLLKNYHIDMLDFSVFSHYMLDDGEWHRKAGWRTTVDGFCMHSGKVYDLSVVDHEILRSSAVMAREQHLLLARQPWYN
jgi:hypothetical protein